MYIILCILSYYLCFFHVYQPILFGDFFPTVDTEVTMWICPFDLD